MNTRAWLRFLPVFAPAGEEGSGGAGEGAGGDGGGAGAGGDGGQSPGGGEGSGEGEGGAPRSSIMDFAPKGGDKGAGEGDDWKLPDGLEVPDHLVGTSAEDTLGKLATAYKGARQELSTRVKPGEGQLEGTVPKEFSGYEITGDGETDDEIANELNTEASKPIVDQWRKAALEVGMPDAAFAKFMKLGMGNMIEAGYAMTGTPEEQAQINGEAEMEALTKEVGQAGADQMLAQMNNFAQRLATNGILQNQADVDEFGQMIGTSRAIQIMQRIIVGEFGEKPIPKAEGVEGALTVEEAYQLQNEAMALPAGAEKEEKLARAEKELRKALASGGSTPGQIRSRVL